MLGNHRSLLLCLALLLVPETGLAQPHPRADSLDELARDIDRLEALRAVKNLQRSYAQYAQFGLWGDIADLFAAQGKVVWGEEEIVGHAAILAWLRGRWGVDGLPQGALNTQLIDDPVVNLSADGRSATARWRHFALLGDGARGATLEGGMHVNHYVLEGGRWKIAELHFYRQFEGNYTDGWGNPGGNTLPIVPYHFDPDTAGVPIPEPSGAAPGSRASLASLAARIAALNAEDAVRNLQHSYGYYVDRKMWDDVVDLFASDGVIEIAGVGTFKGPAGVRAAMERMGPAGLTDGELNDRPQFDAIVTVAPGANEAFARGIELGLLGLASEGEASWEVGVFRNRYVKQEGVWKIREMRVQPLMKADYRTGWGAGGVLADPALPAFLTPNPATGKPVRGEGHVLFAAQPLTGVIASGTTTADAPSLTDLRRRYSRSLAYEGTVNVSAAYGYYLGDSRWDDMSNLFATEGNKQSPFAGFYMGRERIAGAAAARYGPTSARPAERVSGVYHWRPQPVVLVAHDGRSTTLRARLFQLRTSRYDRASGKPNPNIIQSGMYPNDQFVLEDGVWRLWSLTVDEHYFSGPDWQGGWSAAKPLPPGERPPPSPLMETYPPDVAITDLGRREEGFRGGTGTTIVWPGILPMWFHYRNPVSGRLPERYWPDCVPCQIMPEASMISHGYEFPPTGPQDDGKPLR